jgi:hypothetical protein
MQGWQIFIDSNITVAQIYDSLVAIPGFLPVTFCSGYLTGWVTNLNGFRGRSIIGRIFWSLPLSLAVSTVFAVWLGKFFSLAVVQQFFFLSAAVCVAVIGIDWFKRRRSGKRFSTGLNPLGWIALICVFVWISLAVVSLVDFQRDHRLFLSLLFYDHGARVNWVESVLRTGVPPDNPLYLYKHIAPLRYYYFWLVDCAVVAKLWHISARGTMTASCVWAGFCLVALVGIYLKDFLAVGERLRAQFLLAVSLLSVSGLFGLVAFLRIVFFQKSPPANGWSSGVAIPEWWSILMFYPHHVASLVCVMLAFLLACYEGSESRSAGAQRIAVIAAALASAFGLSVYVACAFFFVILAWSVWRLAFERKWIAPFRLALGGAGSCVLLVPYLLELTSTQSKMHGGNVLELAVRPTISTYWLLKLPFISLFAARYPGAAEGTVRTLLLLPASMVELGFFFLVLLIFVFPRLRGCYRLSSAQQSLVVLSLATFPVMSFIRSGVLSVNDFGIHAAMLLQFPLLLLASEFLMSWKFQRSDRHGPHFLQGLPDPPAGWLRPLAMLAITIGVVGTGYQALCMRFLLPIAETQARKANAPITSDLSHIAGLSHKAFISYHGYGELNSSIARDAVVQFNVTDPWIFWKNTDLANVDRQVSIAAGTLWCGAEMGGDPNGCPAMAASINALYSASTADQARSVCHTNGIQYLVASIYDPVWHDKESWVWKLSPVVADPEFRALDCRG